MRIDVDGAARQQVDALGDLAVRSAGAEHRDLARDHRLQRQLDRRREVSDQDHGAALADAANRVRHGVAVAHDFERDVGTAPAGELARRPPARRRLSHSAPAWRPSVAPASSFRVVDVDRDDRAARPSRFSTWIISRPIIPAPTTTAVSSGRRECRLTACTAIDTASISAARSNGRSVRQLVEDPRRHGDVLGEGAVTPVVAARDAQHHAVVAQVDLAAPAEVARAARHRRVERDAIAGREAVDARSRPARSRRPPRVP